MRNYFIIFLVIILSSCNNQLSKSSVEESYEYSLSKFDTVLVKQFPKLQDVKTYGVQTNFVEDDTLQLCNTCFSASSIILYKTFDKNDFDSILIGVKEKSVVKYSSMDSTILSLISYNDRLEIDGKWYNHLESDENKLRCKRSSKLANQIPVPYFSIDEFSDSTSLCNLTNGFEIYVLKAIPGKNSNSIVYDCECLPDKWKHGVVSGYAVKTSSNQIIIWVTAW